MRWSVLVSLMEILPKLEPMHVDGLVQDYNDSHKESQVSMCFVL